ncbi:MAG: alpha-E domain-containing protein [Oscillospiraceae bacterium]|jgi:uncharacterized alpha-E superfamily protein|nr:alpha-E domain-containing protein [Oscillospiraceae bacterium]
MGIISVEHSFNLYWLGRYSERIYTTLCTFFNYYDKTLDKDKKCYKVFLKKLDVEDKYGDYESFIRGYLYNDGVEAPDVFSVDSAFGMAYDNALVIRDVIGSESLAYVHLAVDAFHYSRDAKNLRLALMPAIDYLLAFWGSIDDRLASGEAGTIIKCGKLIERLDLYFRFSYNYKQIYAEYEKLCHVLSHVKKGNPFYYNTERLSVLVEVIGMKGRYKERLDEVLDCLGRLFEEQSA